MYLTFSWICFLLNNFLRYIGILSYKFTTLMCSDIPFRVHYGVSSEMSVKTLVFWILCGVTMWTKIMYSSFVVFISPMCHYSLQKEILTFEIG